MWGWFQLPLQQTPVPKLGSHSVVVLWEQEGAVLLFQGQNVSATTPGSGGLSAFSAGSCWKPSVPQGHQKRGQSISRTSLIGAEVSPQGIPVPLQPPKTQPMPDLLRQPPPQPLFTQLLLLQVPPTLLPIPHAIPSHGVRDWELAMSRLQTPRSIFLSPACSWHIYNLLETGMHRGQFGKAKENPWHVPSGISSHPQGWASSPGCYAQLFLTSPVRRDSFVTSLC